MKGNIVKNKKYQSGSAHLIIVFVLVLALLGALGFVVWRNFIQTKPTAAFEDTDTTTITDTDLTISTTSNAVATTATLVADAQHLTITEWGLKGVYNGLYGMRYEIYNNSLNKEGLVFTSSDFSENSCNNGSVGVGLIYRSPSLPSASEATIKPLSEFDGVDGEFYQVDFIRGDIVIYKHVGDHYYSHNFNYHFSCATQGTSDAILELNIRTSIKLFFATLTAA